MSLPSVDWAFLGQRIGLGAVLGLAVGYTAKKALKVVLVIVALLLLVMLALQSLDVISINWHVVEEAYSQTFQHPDGVLGSLSQWAGQLQSVIPVAGSFVVGFFIGFKLG